MSVEDESIQEFIIEASELLESAEQGLLKIEEGQEYQVNFNSVFRAFHSIKGGAGMLGLTETNKVVHFLEDILTEANRTKSIDANLVDYFFRGIDSIRKAIDGEDHGFEFKSPLEESRKKDTDRNNISKIPKKSFTGAKIFHVDDEQEILEIFKDFLEYKGHEVRSFLTGEELLENLEPGKVDIVISDFNMPKMNGNEVIRNVKSIDPDIPVMLLSGCLEQQTCIDAVNYGAFALLEKPMNMNQVETTINNAHSNVKYSRLVSKSIRLLMYQFSDLSDFLIEAGKEDIIQTIKSEMEGLIEERNFLRESKKKDKTA